MMDARPVDSVPSAEVLLTIYLFATTKPMGLLITDLPSIRSFVHLFYLFTLHERIIIVNKAVLYGGCQ